MGKVYLVGAGPGDPGLLTVKGLDCIRKADVVVYDRLAHPDILARARPDAELIYVGKGPGAHTVKQEDISRLLVSKAQEGKTVVRLKGGDPYVFGRGGEEAEILASSSIPFEVVPGVTSAVAVPAYAGIPVTHRAHCSALGIITGHEDPAKPESRIRWDKIATGIDTLVLLMAVENLPSIVTELVENGRDPSTPVALIRWGTRAEQQTLVGTLEDIVEQVRATGFESPAVTVVGDVVKLRDKLRWFDNRPLSGKKVLVTRSRDQAGALSEALREHGAEPIEFPVIRISPPTSFAPLDAALDCIADYDWVLFTSANGVRALLDRVRDLGRDVRSLKGPKIGAIGPKTAEAVADAGISVDFTPTEFVAEAVVREFPENPSGKRILIPRAEQARKVLPDKLTEQGASVDVVESYRTEIEDSDTPPERIGTGRIKDMLAAGEIDIVTFTSSSTVQNFATLAGKGGAISLPEDVKVACIGPITAQTATDCGLKVHAVADQYTIEGLVAAILAISTH